jgi:hypothetical protein
MSDNVRLQNLRDFTVQIRDPSSDAIVGTGIVVSMDGRIVTCAHVVRAANVEPRDGDGAEVGVYFPQGAAARAGAARPPDERRDGYHWGQSDADEVLAAIELPADSRVQ